MATFWEDRANMLSALHHIRRRRRSLFVATRKDPSSFGEVYLTHSTEVLRYFVRQTLDPQAAFDLMAETFAKALDTITQFDGDDDEEGRAWLFGIATHQLTYWRTRHVVAARTVDKFGLTVMGLGLEEFERIEQLADLKRFQPVLDEALPALPPHQRELLELRLVEGQPYDQIVRTLGWTTHETRRRASSALRQLAVVLERVGALSEDRPSLAAG